MPGTSLSQQIRDDHENDDIDNVRPRRWCRDDGTRRGASWESMMQPLEQMQLDFQGGSKHFFLMVHREGRES
jgi:hypothetical protein